ncbi:hypothetical protein ABBQ32_001579 [Trebouxia sp. C0010 RCD-2024]
MPDEAVAALCMLCYQDLNGKASSSSEHPEAAGGEGEAEASQLQALGAQKPTHHKAPTQTLSLTFWRQEIAPELEGTVSGHGALGLHAQGQQLRV